MIISVFITVFTVSAACFSLICAKINNFNFDAVLFRIAVVNCAGNVVVVIVDSYRHDYLISSGAGVSTVIWLYVAWRMWNGKHRKRKVSRSLGDESRLLLEKVIRSIPSPRHVIPGKSSA
jgi:hypothetical protein